jgi:hypothetical protein
MRTAQDEKLLRIMEDPVEREVLVDLLKHRSSGHGLVDRERLVECASHAAFDALLDFEFTVGEEAGLIGK